MNKKISVIFNLHGSRIKFSLNLLICNTYLYFDSLLVLWRLELVWQTFKKYPKISNKKRINKNFLFPFLRNKNIFCSWLRTFKNNSKKKLLKCLFLSDYLLKSSGCPEN